MFRREKAELKDVDIILDVKLDELFNSEEVASMERSDMEKAVNYCEEDIRENIEKYVLVHNDESIVAVYSIDEYQDGKIMDFFYVMQSCRDGADGEELLNMLLNETYQPLYISAYKTSSWQIELGQKCGFEKNEEYEYKVLLKNDNIKEENNRIKVDEFKNEVEKLAKKYGLAYSFEYVK